MNRAAKGVWLITFLISAAVSVYACRSNDSAVANARALSDLPDSERPATDHPLEITLSAEQGKLFRSGEEIPLSVTIKNRGSQEVLVCVGEWHLQKGLISFKVFDTRGSEVRVLRRFHADFTVDESSDLVPLKAGEERSGSLDLTIRDTVYDFHRGMYRVVAEYFCPIQGRREFEGRTLAVVSEPQRSLPISVDVDYRSWWERLTDLGAGR